MADLYANYTADIYDGLINDVKPAPIVEPATIRKLGTAGTLARGTVLAISTGTAGDSKLVILGSTAATNETLTAYGILCDDTEVGTSADVKALVYVAGTFDPAKLTVKSGYTMTLADKMTLRDGGIYLKAAVDADYSA